MRGLSSGALIENDIYDKHHLNYLDDGDDEMKRYQLQIDDDKLWRDVKKKATACGITIGIGITELLRYWVRGEFDNIIDEFDDLDKE